MLDAVLSVLAPRLDAAVQPLEDDAAALVIAGRQRVLVRQHARVVGISTPRRSSWQVRTAVEASARAPEIAAALEPPVVTLGEVALAIRGALAPAPWRLAFPGTPVPSEAWLRWGARSIGLFQSDGAVRIVVWIGGSALEQRLHAATELDAARLDDALTRQAQWLTDEAAARAREAALPRPTVAEVIGALKAGARVRVGVSRSHETWYWDAGLRADVFDEGMGDVRKRTEAELEAAIAAWPAPFRAALGR